MNKFSSKLISSRIPGLSDRQHRIYNFLKSNPIGVLSTVTPDGEPHGTVIYYTVDLGFAISFLTKADTRKYDNIKRNDHIMLTVYEPLTQAVAQITGKATELENSKDVNRVAGLVLSASLETSEVGIPPLSKLEAGAFVAFKIEPVQIRMAVYARPDPGDYSELFETLENFELKEY